MEKHFVTFYSPGTFLHETVTLPIEEWDVEQAVEKARSITMRHGATPFGFSFSTRTREDNELDSRETKSSPMYYLGGKVLTLEDIKARKDPKDRVLISNMQCNNWDRVVENCNSYLIVQPLQDSDVVLDFKV